MTSTETPAVENSTSKRTKRPLREDGEDAHEPVAFGRQCFITVGATAGFRQLIEEAMSDDFLRTLASLGYDRIDIQCGPDHDFFKMKASEIREFYGLKIRHFGYTGDMQSHMVECRGKAGHRLPGCIISHAGSSFLGQKHQFGPKSLTFGAIHPTSRLWNNSRSLALRSAPHCCSQSNPHGQPPGRARGRVREYELGHPRQARVSEDDLT